MEMDFWKIKWTWEEMCGPSGLQPWNETTKDLGLCFEKLFLEIPLSFIIAVVSAFYVGYRRDWVTREKTQERAIVLRSFVVLALVFIPIIELYVFVSDAAFVLYPIDYFVAGASCLCWLMHFAFLVSLKHRLGPSPRGPAALLAPWAAALAFAAVAVRSRTLAGAPAAAAIATLCCHVLYLLTLIPSSDSRPTYYSPCLVGSQHNHNEYTPLLPHIDEDILGTAMQGVGFFSKLTLSWVEPLIRKGLDDKLSDPEELFDLPVKLRCSYTGARIDRALVGNVDQHQQFEDIPHEPFISSGYGATGESTPVTPTSRVLVRPARRQRVSLLRALHACFALQFYSIGVLKLVADTAGFAGPLLLNRLITFIQDDSIDLHYGYMYAAGLLGATLTSAIFNTHFNWLMSQIGIKMQGAIVSTILRKTLSVTSPELTKAFSVGEITNFMSTDTDRIVNSCPSFHALWSIPLQLFITLFLMYQQVGVSFLAGVAFSVVLIPVNRVIATRIGRLSTQLMRHKDVRVSLVADMLRGIRTVKMHVWEDYFIDKIAEARRSELRYLRGRKYLDAVCVVLWATTPVLVAALTLGTQAARGGRLDAPTVFTTVALVNMLIAPLNAFPWVLNGLTEAWVSVKRIQTLLELPDMDPERYYDRLNTNRDEESLVILKDASFAWATPRETKQPPPRSRKNKGKSKKRLSKTIQRRDSSSSSELPATSDQPFMLRDISLEIGREDFIGITGGVGSGKTSLLHAIVGDMTKRNGSIQITENLDSFGYVSQTPWLVRGTVRDNILFGRPYDEAKFTAVVDACALTEDLNVLGWGARVGDGGCTLSGGQRARISLARAVYQDKQVYLLDDILSCVDARVAQHVMQRCILGLLKRTARLVVAHSPRHLARADSAILLKDGRIVARGHPEVVLNEMDEFLPSEPESAGEDPAAPPAPPAAPAAPADPDDDRDAVSRDSLAEEEAMSRGAVRWWVVALYLRSVGWLLALAVLLALLLMQLSQNLTFLWLAYWVRSRAHNATTDALQLAAADAHETTSLLDHGFIAADAMVHSIVDGTLALMGKWNGENSTRSPAATVVKTQVIVEALPASDSFYLQTYFGLAAATLLLTVVRAFLFAHGGVLAAARLHRRLLNVVVKAKVKFFDTTPAGRVMNRFSSDTYTVDDSLPFILNILLAQLFSLLGAMAVTVYGLPWVLAALLPLAPLYYRLQRRYRAASRQLKRLQSVTLAPVYTHFGDTLQGLTSIRALGGGGRWLDAGGELVERCQRAALSSAAAAQWLALRLQASAVLVVGAGAALAVLQRETHSADPGLVGLAISYALSMTSMLSGLMSAFTETERELVAVERLGEYLRQVECESVEGAAPPYGWPSQGVLAFEDVVLKYSERASAAAALAGVSFATRPGEKLGVAGRSGAGKSSLLHAVLRLHAPARGRVLIDGVDVATLHLHALRSRIGVIPQEPFLFAGSVRENVDPLHVHSDAEVWRALERCGARAGVAARGGLAASARGVSRGLAQLLCVARALLQRAKVLLVDEATANLDQETERLILDTLRLCFAGCTVLFVAHRVAGVLQCRRALLLAGGRLLELAPPEDLLQDPTSEFYKLVHAQE